MYAKLEHLTKILKRVFRTVFQLKVKKVKIVSWYIQRPLQNFLVLSPFALREKPEKKSHLLPCFTRLWVYSHKYQTFEWSKKLKFKKIMSCKGQHYTIEISARHRSSILPLARLFRYEHSETDILLLSMLE